MGLIVNGTPPTTIKVIKDGNTTDLIKLETKDAQASIEARWGKPYILTIDAGEHSTITVTRTESLYQNAPLETLQDGSLIYNGDQIRINVSVDSGYKLTKLLYCTQVNILGEEKWNEVEISDGYTTSSAMTSIDGTFNTNVKIISTVEQSASWKTVWTGTRTFGEELGGYSNEVYGYVNYTLPQQAPTRVTYSCSAIWSDGDEAEYQSSQTSELPTQVSYYGSQDGGITGTIKVNGANRVEFSGLEVGDAGYAGGSITITKIEQYY